MKIAAINTTADPGQAPARIMLDVLGAAASRGDSTLALYGRGEAPARAGIGFQRVGSRLGVLTHAAMSRLIDREGYCSRRAAGSVINALKIFKPDVVHLHNLHGHYMHLPLLLEYLERTQVPVVVTLHDLWLLTGRCCFPGECRSWQSECRNCTHRRLYPPTLLSHCHHTQLLKAHLMERLDNVTLVAPSRWVARQVSESHLRLCPTLVIPNGVDSRIFFPPPVGTHPGASTASRSPATPRHRRYLAVARRWEARKHPEKILSLTPLLRDHEELIIVGMKPGDVPQHPRVTALPLIDDPRELAKLYRSADLLLNPSTDETYGMSVAEAMACGTPALIPPGRALEEIFAPLGAAVTPWDNPEEVMEMARTVTANPPTIITPPDTTTMTAAYLNLFDDITR